MRTLETQRLILRPFRRADLQDFHEYGVSSEVGPNAGWKPHQSMHESRVALRGLIKGGCVWAIVLRETGRVVGSVGLHEDDKRPEVEGVKMLGYALARPQWGNGIMTEAALAVIDEAFQDPCLLLLSVRHFTGNARSRRVIEKCGFRCEGLMRRAEKNYDGTIADERLYSLTRRDWEAARREREAACAAGGAERTEKP